MRGFEWVPGVDCTGLSLPRRQTEGAAGYDLALCEEVAVPAGKIVLAPTGVRALVPDGEFVGVFARSSLALKYGLVLANGVGVIDSDYYGNPDNGGHIYVPLWNTGEADVLLPRGERVAQAIFLGFSLADGDDPAATVKRMGGFGSTNHPGGPLHR